MAYTSPWTTGCITPSPSAACSGATASSSRHPPGHAASGAWHPMPTGGSITMATARGSSPTRRSTTANTRRSAPRTTVSTPSDRTQPSTVPTGRILCKKTGAFTGSPALVAWPYTVMVPMARSGKVLFSHLARGQTRWVRSSLMLPCPRHPNSSTSITRMSNGPSASSLPVRTSASARSTARLARTAVSTSWI